MHLTMSAGIAFLLALLAPLARAGGSRAGDRGIDHGDWNAPQKPFQIYGNSWYVGPYGLSSILVDTGQGLALFDGDLPESPPVIEANVRALGFRVEDIKWILSSHAHPDHAGGIAALQGDSGAQVLTSAAGARQLALGGQDRDDPQYQQGAGAGYPPVLHARVVADGEVVQLGRVAITAHYTPGHTAGSTSWTWRSCARGRCLRIAYVDSLSAISAPGYRFSEHPEKMAAFHHAIAVAAALPCDILLTPHPDASDFWQKVERRTSASDAAPFINSHACRAYAAAAAQALQATLKRERSATAAKQATAKARSGQ